MAFNNQRGGGGGGRRGGGSGGGGSRQSNRPRRDMVFHDALVNASPVRVRVDAEPKWLDEKENYIVELTVYDPEGGAPSQLAYWAENPACGEFFEGQVGKTFTIMAEGGGKGKKDTGLITYVGESGETLPPSQETLPPAEREQQKPPAGSSAPRQPSQKSGAAAPTHADIVKNTLDALKRMGRQGSALQLAAQQTLKEVIAFMTSNGVEVTPEEHNELVTLIGKSMTETTFSTLFIEFNKQQRCDGLPTKDVLVVIKEARDRKAKGEPAIPQNKPAPKPKCPKHEVELSPDGSCPTCVEDAKKIPDDDVPF